MQKARGHPTAPPKRDDRLPQLVGTRFQVLFHPPPGVLFTFPSRYWFTIGHRLVFSLGRWSCQVRPGFHVSRPTQETVPNARRHFAYGALTLYGPAFQPGSTRLVATHGGPADPPEPSLQPRDSNDCRLDTATVWALPLSLAATQGITVVFSSSGYLDVSVLPVRFLPPMYSAGDDWA